MRNDRKKSSAGPSIFSSRGARVRPPSEETESPSNLPAEKFVEAVRKVHFWGTTALSGRRQKQDRGQPPRRTLFSCGFSSGRPPRPAHFRILTGIDGQALKNILDGHLVFAQGRVAELRGRGQDAARGEIKSDFIAGGRLGNSSPRRKSPGFGAMILK